MSRANSKTMKMNSRQLRKDMTEEERKLWYKFLAPLSVHIYRQKVIGKYIVDFYCAKAKIVIELDGSQHYEDKGAIEDNIRDAFLKEQGITVLRYTNRQINEHFQDVCEDIYIKIFGAAEK